MSQADWDPLKELVGVREQDPDVSVLPPEVLDAAFDLDAALRNAHVAFDRLAAELGAAHA